MSNYDPLDIRGQERTKAERDLREKLSKDIEESDIKWLMSSKRGRRFLWRHLDQAGVFRLSFNTNAMAMAFAEGNRNFGLRTLDMIHSLCPELYPTMVKEHNGRHTDNDSTNNQ